jgi:hypothetical protein
MDAFVVWMRNCVSRMECNSTRIIVASTIAQTSNAHSFTESHPTATIVDVNASLRRNSAGIAVNERIMRSAGASQCTQVAIGKKNVKLASSGTA